MQLKKPRSLHCACLQHSVTCLAPLRRSSTNACLNNALGGTVHPSVGVLNRPELHGTRKITLGKNIYLHHNLYFETQDGGCIKIGIDVVLSRGFHLVAFAGIGKYSSIRDANHRVITGSSVHYSGHLDKPVTIRCNAWIGWGA
jgi:acetyltransferase-like isoleucine patch superfamily enzyme